MAFQSFDLRLLRLVRNVIVPADGTASATLLTSGAYGSLVSGILVSNADVIDHVVTLGLTFSGNWYPIDSVNVPAGAGSAGVTPVDLSQAPPLLALGGLLLPPAYNLAWKVEVAITAAHVLVAQVVCGDF